eukprot:TRINITY_DN21402_c0_g1_i1.p1 TRINITY_DN21402_c0_g1~~TRINITY_DN21402_c0_g1_i1.p1  ORF type:complete len:269 (+),score=34.94 TRINITY_DN21402_c0_g1_i1:33-839(+)
MPVRTTDATKNCGVRHLLPNPLITDFLTAAGLMLLPIEDRVRVMWDKAPFSSPTITMFIRGRMDSDSKQCCTPEEAVVLNTKPSNSRRRRASWVGDLVRAARNGDIETLKIVKYLGIKAEKDATTSKGPVLEAALAGHSDCLVELLNMGGDIHEKDAKGLSVIHAVCLAGKLECLEVLIDRGIDLNIQESKGWTPLHFAKHSGHTQCASLLLRHGACPNICDIWGNTADDNTRIPNTVKPRYLHIYPALPDGSEPWLHHSMEPGTVDC